MKISFLVFEIIGFKVLKRGAPLSEAHLKLPTLNSLAITNYGIPAWNYGISAGNFFLFFFEKYSATEIFIKN
jgi:hypothetical protein